MTSYADHDAELVAHGIRIGGKGDVLTSAPAGQALTVDDLERLARPDISHSATQQDDGYEHVGMCKIAHADHGYVIATECFGWLPGRYDTRDAALAAYGYVLGGEGFGYLDDLKKRWGHRAITAEDIQGLPVR